MEKVSRLSCLSIVLLRFKERKILLYTLFFYHVNDEMKFLQVDGKLSFLLSQLNEKV